MSMYPVSLLFPCPQKRFLLPACWYLVAHLVGHTIQEDSQRDQRDRRSHNGNIGLRVPEEVIQNKCQRYKHHSRKVLHRTELINDSDFTIIELFQAEYRGLVEYYR